MNENLLWNVDESNLPLWMDNDELENLSDFQVIRAYSKLMEELKRRKIIKSSVVTGDLGEFYALEYYNHTGSLPKLQQAPPNTKNVDAISINGERYSIKSVTTKTTGAFYGMNEPGSTEPERQVFEYLIIVVMNKSFELQAIYELTWEQFLKHCNFAKRIRAYNLHLNQSLIEDCRVVYRKD